LPSGAPANGQDRFRFPEEKDLQSLYELDQLAFGKVEGYSYLVVRQWFVVHQRDFLLLERDGVLCGYALAALASDGTAVASLLALAVLPELREQGCGWALLHAAVGHAREIGARRMDLAVRPDNEAARRLYLKYGFRDSVAEPLPDYYGEGRARMLMSLPLV